MDKQEGTDTLCRMVKLSCVGAGAVAMKSSKPPLRDSTRPAAAADALMGLGPTWPLFSW